MDYEKKYKEALERARQFSEKPYLEDSKGIVDYIFPELKESEDERIELLNYLYDVHDDDEERARWIAWLEKQGQNNMGISEATKQKLEDNLNKALEKETPDSLNKFLEEQGEQKPVPKFKIGDTMRTLQEAKDGWTDGMPFVVSIDSEYYNCNSEKIAIKDQDEYEYPPMNRKHNICDSCDEQKPADKVETKFKVGDWVMLDRPVLITKVKDMPYNIHEYWTSEGTWFGSAAKAKLWTIQDAKDGDVLTYPDGSITLFKYMNENIYMAHVLLVDGHIELNNSCAVSNVHPATKEQRDTLMKAMADAGYTFDFEKKELKKIEQKPWSEEDAVILGLCIDAASGYYNPDNKERLKSWLYSLKDRILPQPKKKWSEQDEYNKRQVCRILREAGCSQKLQDKIKSWLESFRFQPHWKPSGEQIEALKDALNDAIWQYDFKGSMIKEEITRKHAEVIESLYNDLKKLIE